MTWLPSHTIVMSEVTRRTPLERAERALSICAASAIPPATVITVGR
jgi:hypothetical protein